MTTRTYTNRSNAVRAAKAALGPTALSDVHFKITQDGDEFAWVPMSLETGRPEGEGETHHVEARLPETAVVTPKADALDVLEAGGPTRTEQAPAVTLDPSDPLVVGGRRYGNATRAAEARKALEARAAKAAKADAPKAPKVERGPKKSDALVEAALRDTGVTPDEVREMTGWTKLGGFYGAVKSAGHVLRTFKELKATRWFAEPTGGEGTHAYIRREAGGAYTRLGVFADRNAALAAAPEDFVLEDGKDGGFILTPRTSVGG